MMTTQAEAMILEVDDEQIVLDESFFDFDDFTVAEAAQAVALGGPLKDGEPTAGSVAIFIYVKLCRGREWGRDHFMAVVPLLVAWLTDNLVPVEEV